MKRLFVFAGEKSGDLHGSHLIKALRQNLPNLICDGVAGPSMRSQGVHGPLMMEDFEVMGFTDVILALPKLCKNFYKIRNHILLTAPEATLLIDYPGFNLRLAKALRQKGYKGKIIQYISPTVWAWGKHRIEMMAQTLDLLLSIYPFEAQYFADTSLHVVYVGNPLSEYINNYQYDESWQKKTGLPPTKNLIALFPGSRKSEITRNLPILIEVAEKILQEYPESVFGLSCAHPETHQFLKTLRSTISTKLQKAIFTVPSTYTYELMRDSRAAMAKSGTVTLELALHNCPTAVIYKLTLLNRFYGKYILKLNLPNYCIVNILAEKTIFPEFIENGLTPQNLFHHFQTLYANGDVRIRCEQGCLELQKSLGVKSKASTEAAQTLINFLS